MNPQAFVFFFVCMILWGVFFAWTVRQWWAVLRQKVKTRSAVVIAFRRMLTAWCLFILPFASVVYGLLTEAGIGTETFRLLAYFTLAGSYVVGGLFAVISLKVD